MHDSITLVLSGEAGQGLQTVEEFLVESLTRETYVFSSKEVMSRVRGGNNSVEIRVAAEPVTALRYTIDYLFLFNDHAIERLRPRLTENTVIVGEANFLAASDLNGHKQKAVPFIDMAKQAGNRLYENTAMFGYIAGLLSANTENAKAVIAKRFAKRGEAVVNGNLAAFDLGYAAGSTDPDKPGWVMPKAFVPKPIMTGNEALTLGALAGGVNYLAAYPMSPGTTLMTMLEDQSREFGVLVEQAEDEIAALNMVIGAWYAGARALTTTSGGGFALMTEAVSLAGITESPAVIHIAQRPGPATGLPTRTEQGDLNLAVYAGHGEFPRIIYAPARIGDGVELMARAFHMADKYQIPAFVLSDQYWLESITQHDPITIPTTYATSSIIETHEDYLRYKLDTSGISPRGIPGYGKGLVKVDSDEHHEDGTITESFAVRQAMNQKRLNKFNLMKADQLDPIVNGSTAGQDLLISWGSTYGIIQEVVDTHPEKGWTHWHFIQVFPLPQHLEEALVNAKSITVIENNATGQLANLIQQTYGIKVTRRINKSTGEPFHVDELETLLEVN
jgi:2-oxoglutarate/2-oxoacid ferredoxin oxidoreductase subunit alpha